VAPNISNLKCFGALGDGAVTNTGLTTIYGLVGTSPGASISGFPLGVSCGLHPNDAQAFTAQTNAQQAYTNLVLKSCNVLLSCFYGQIFTPAVYCFGSSAVIGGPFTLDGLGDPNSVFIFQVPVDMLVIPCGVMTFINGASPYNVFWTVGTSVIISGSVTFYGNIIAQSGLFFSNGAQLVGVAATIGGSITLNGNTITTSCNCTPT